MSATIEVGGTQQFTASVRDVLDNVLTGRSVVWSSTDQTIATVDASGLATGVAAGTCTITAQCEGKTGTSSLQVQLGVPTTPAELIAKFNSLGTAQLVGLFIASGPDASAATRTVVADGTSPTGYRLTMVENLCNIGGGQHFRPTAAFPTGTPCLADGSVVNELEIPGVNAGNLSTNGGDTTPTTPVLNVGGTLIDMLSDRSIGLTWGTLGLQKADFGSNPKAFKIGEDGGATTLEWDQSNLLLGEAIGGSYIPRAEYWCGTPGSGQQFLNHGTKGPVNAALYITTALNSYNSGTALGGFLFGRDIPMSNPVWDASNYLAAGRRIRWGTGHNNDPAQAKNLFYCIHGRSTRAQWKTLNDYFLLQHPTLLDDTNPLAIALGCSFTIQMSSGTSIYAGDFADALLGDGATVLPCFANLGLGGRNNRDLYPYVNWIRDLDYSKRTLPVAFYYNEQQNSNPATALIDTYWVLDQLRLIVAGGKAISIAEPLYQQGLDAGVLARLADMRANALSHSDAFLDIAAWTAYDAQYIGDGSIGGEDQIYWTGQHPSSVHEQEKRAWLRIILRSFWGLASSSGLAAYGRPAAGSETVNLTAGAPIANPGVTWFDVLKNALGAKTVQHTTSDGTKLTVDADGTMHRVAVGDASRLTRVTSDHTEAIAITKAHNT
jgi:hypothetical protein